MAAHEPGARKKLKEFLLQHVGGVLDSDDLREASEIIRDTSHVLIISLGNN